MKSKTKPQIYSPRRTDTDDLFATTGEAAITNYELEITNGKSNNLKSENQKLPVSDKFVIRNSKFVIDKKISNSQFVIRNSVEDSPAAIRNSKFVISNSCRRKPTGVPWLGDIPEHWEVKRLRYITSINDETLPEDTPPDYELLYVDIGSIDPAVGITDKESFTFENAPSRARRIVRDGDVIISTVRTYLKAIASIKNPEDNLIVSTGFAVIRSKNVFQGYLSYTVKAPFFVETVVSRSIGVSYPAINASDLGLIEIPLPPLPEQKAIAEYLDRKTGRIDSLISKKENLVELLKEKRGGLISSAVTGKLTITNYELEITNDKSNNSKLGIDKKIRNSQFVISNSSKMKPSGINWLGDIPTHWEVKKIKHISSIRYGIGEPPAYYPEGTPLIRATNIDHGKVVKENLVFVDPTEIPSGRIVWLSAGDIIVVRSGAYTGDSAIIPKEWQSSIAGFDMVIHPTGINPSFFSYALLSGYLRDGQIFLEKMRAAQPHLNAEELGSCIVICPPLPEQKAIVEYLDRETGKIDSLISRVESAIGKLKEYRSAVISAAVTGKILITN